MKDKKSITITIAFQKILDESNCKPNKLWVDKGSEFNNRSIKSWLLDNDIEMHSTHNKGKYVVAERFIRTLTKFITSSSKNLYNDNLADIQQYIAYHN